MTYDKDLSIVISLYNEEESLPELIQWIESVMTKEGYKYEVIMVNDGSKEPCNQGNMLPPQLRQVSGIVPRICSG